MEIILFREISILDGKLVWYPLRRDREFCQFKTGFRYRKVSDFHGFYFILCARKRELLLL